MIVLPPRAHAQAPSQAQAQGDKFSFIMYGDSRTMMYLPFKQRDESNIYKALLQVFELAMPAKMAEEVIKKDVKLTFDPTTKELTNVVMPFETKTEVAYLKIDKGWVTDATVEDTKLLPGVHRTMFRLSGGDWVARDMLAAVNGGLARFVLSTGDLVWWGNQGKTVKDSPYWKRLNEALLSKLPAVDQDMKTAGLGGRYFLSVGNHDVWGDPKIEGVLSAVPYLKNLGLTADRPIYKFDYKGVRFISLWTGPYDDKQPSAWDATNPPYEQQMAQMKTWLDDAKAKGIKKVFIAFHAPVFCRSGMGPIPDKWNPHKVIAGYKKDFDEITVLNGHVHTTEAYDVDGVKYVVMGGGGAEQDPILPGRTSIKVPADYPQDLYWRGQPPVEEYNYVRIDIDPAQKTRFWVTRWRPGSAKQFETVELFQENKPPAP
jgi:hypothetical protein